MRSLLVCFGILSFSALAAQDDFLRSLAVEVCNCLHTEGVKLSEVSASSCLDTVGLRHEGKLRYRYNLVITNPGQKDVLADLLIDDLLDVCPVLQTVRPPNTQRELRWADGRRPVPSGEPRFVAPKRPPADTAGTITSEPPLVWRATGILTAQPGSKGLRLRTAQGEEMSFDLPVAAARKRDFDPGDEVSLTYRREWRTREGAVVLVVVAID